MQLHMILPLHFMFTDSAPLSQPTQLSYYMRTLLIVGEYIVLLKEETRYSHGILQTLQD